MSWRLPSLALVLSSTLTLTSCSHDGGVPPAAEVISVAVGAEVTLMLQGDSSSCGGTPESGCLGERPWELESVSLAKAGPFELGEWSLDQGTGTVLVTVKALEVGETVLVVDHKSLDDKPTQDLIILRAAEITRVAPRISCQDGQLDLPQYPITAGSTFVFDLTAMDGDTPLASGDMELLEDAAGFEILGDPGDFRQAIAPAAPGSYTWDLVGSDGLDFAIYEPSDLELTLNEEDGGVRIGRVVGDVPVCVHEGGARATIEITQGSCLPLVQGYEIEGALPVDMGQGGFLLELSGKDTCEVTASLDGGKPTSVSVAVDNQIAPPDTTTHGDLLTATPISVDGEPDAHDSCPLVINLTNGTCEIIDAFGFILPDVDCLLDWEWVKELYSTSGYDDTPVAGKVGVGLWVELRLGIRYELLGTVDFGTYSTNNLTYVIAPAGGLEIESTGCISSEREVLALRPTAAGNYTINLDADNVYEPSSIVVPAAPIESVYYDTDAEDVKTTAAGTEAWWFIGSETTFDVLYFGAASALLYGDAPVLVSSETPGSDAHLQGRRVWMGAAPADVRLASEVGPDTHLMHVVDASTIGGVGGLTAGTIALGMSQCLAAYPTEAGGTRINGQSPVRPRATIGGTAVVVDAQMFSPDSLCLRGYAPGTSDVGVSWGAGNAQAAFTVQ